MLPEIRKTKLPTLTFPCSWQAVIFRNYGYVRVERIAAVLGCDVKTVKDEAHRLGLGDESYEVDFETRGFITIIRNNWFLLPYSQLMTLLGFSEERLDFVLEKEDFLSVKLGKFKPECKAVKFSPLTESELAQTAKIRDTVRKNKGNTEVRPFDFFNGDAVETRTRISGSSKKIVHGYLSPCGDPFDSDLSQTIPDSLLDRYRSMGINGIWLHGVLSNLSPYPFLPELSLGYRERRERLNALISRCRAYGIDVYLYLNEPRALPTQAIDRYSHIVGWRERGTLCLEHKEVRDYLYNAVRDLCEGVPGLGGIFTITMSENATHCNYRTDTGCPICRHISPERTAAMVNNIIARAVRDSGCGGELIANLWGWSPFLGWTEEQTFHGIELLDKDISVLCVSEYDLEIEKGGIPSRIIDYSISNPGPSEISKKILKKAAECGHRIYAKIQATNSWECSAVPYIPVFDLIYEHVKNLRQIGVNDYFLTWTLGGYPSPALALASAAADGIRLDDWYKEEFGELSDSVHSAVLLLCDAFREYPFSLSSLYYSPKTLGPANLWDTVSEEKNSSMVCYSYDDYQTWCEPYPCEIYISQMEKLLDGWHKGLEALRAIPQSPTVVRLNRYAEAVYLHFNSDFLQTKFAILKKDGDTRGMQLLLTQERDNSARLAMLMRQDATIGFEASNHYLYTERNLIEKILRTLLFNDMLECEVDK